jgi:hypothetical protein
MCCERVEQQLGSYLDEELSTSERADVESHLENCAGCRLELAELAELAEGLAAHTAVDVPPTVWEQIERDLDVTSTTVLKERSASRLRVLRTRWALAAAVVLAAGLAFLGNASFETRARASTVDFTALLDALPLNPHKAFTDFLIRYDAKLETAESAKSIAKHLNFATPEVLPGGFRLRSVYQLRMGREIGIAASYDRDGEFLAAVFHPPMKHERFGPHANFPCVIGDKCGHKVQVGEWKLVHLTDPSTCHCLLSRIDEKSEMPAVMSAIAPGVPDQRLPNDRPHP